MFAKRRSVAAVSRSVVRGVVGRKRETGARLSKRARSEDERGFQTPERSFRVTEIWAPRATPQARKVAEGRARRESRSESASREIPRREIARGRTCACVASGRVTHVPSKRARMR